MEFLKVLKAEREPLEALSESAGGLPTRWQGMRDWRQKTEKIVR